MANNLESNITQKLARSFMKSFESMRVLSKNVNTQILSGVFGPDTGDTVSFKRPTDYKSKRTSDGDISGGTRSGIITGKCTGTVQDMFTVDVEWNRVEEALELDQLDQLLAPMATRIKTDLEVDFASFMMKNTNLLAGTPGTAVSTWDHVARAGAMMASSGVPQDGQWNYTVNPFTQASLASNQRSLGAGAGDLISEAHRQAIISDNFAGMKVMTATTLDSFTIATGADRAGTLTAAPTPTYVGAKDTMQQTLAVTAFQANLVVKAGETIRVTGVNRLNLSTRKPIIDQTGAVVLFSGTVTTDVTLGAVGEGNIVISGAGIFEATGAYNTIEAAIANGAVVTLLGTAGDIIQPNLFWHKDAFSIGSVPIPKLFATDTLMKTEDGLQLRVSKYSDGDANKQICRFDFHPAYSVINPFFAGQGHG